MGRRFIWPIWRTNPSRRAVGSPLLDATPTFSGLTMTAAMGRSSTLLIAGENIAGSGESRARKREIGKTWPLDQDPGEAGLTCTSETSATILKSATRLLFTG